MKQLKYFALAMLAVLFLAGPALAEVLTPVLVTDLYEDLNTVDSVSAGQGLTFIMENYGEDGLVQYPSHDGYGVVNAQGQYFDKIVEFTVEPYPVELIYFEIANSTGYEWSDYHIEFWDMTFQNRLDSFPLLSATNGDEGGPNFMSMDFDGSILSFYAPGSVPDNSGLYIQLEIDPFVLNEPGFGMRQVATTVVPEPISSTLFVVGAATLGFRRFRKSV